MGAHLRKAHELVAFTGCEPFEARCLLSVQAAGVGGYFDGQYLTPYSVDASIDDRGAVSGSRRDAGSSGASSATTMSVEAVSFLPGGRYIPSFRPSFTPYSSVTGSAFIDGATYPVGWFSGLDSGYSRAEFTLLTERADDLTLADLAGSWKYTSVIVTQSETLAAYGTLSVSGSRVARTTMVAGQGQISDVVMVTSVQASGAIRLSDGQYAWASRSKRTALAADLSLSDGQASVSLIYQVGSRTSLQVAGGYRVGLVATGPFATSVSGLPAALLNVFLDLRNDGTFSQYDLASYDGGGRTPIATGTWSASGSAISVRETSTARTWNYDICSDGITLVPRSTSTSGSVDQLFGSALRVIIPTPPAFSVVQDGDAPGSSRLYVLQSDSSWLSVDLEAKAGGPEITGKVVTWTDPKDGMVYAAAQTGNSLMLYRNAPNGAWSSRDLQATIPGASSVASNLAVMVDSTNIVHLTGLTPSGDLVRYSQTTAPPVWEDYTWTFSNIADRDLRAHGESMPSFVGPTVSYATAWGGLNVAGLDGAGNIWSVWWAPGATRWSSANLTSAYGADPVAGGLTVYLTPWGGINIAGLDESGQIQVTWWVPSFGGNWEHSNLTAAVDGPRYTLSSVSSYVSSWGGLNITGVDRDTGQVKVYWWSPALTSQGWAVTAFADVLPSSAPRPERNLRGVAGPDSSLNVFGVSDTGRFVRYYWYPAFGGEWRSETVSSIARTA